MDHGREFYLILFIQQYLRSMHGPLHIMPFVQSTSKEVCVCTPMCNSFALVILFLESNH